MAFRCLFHLHTHHSFDSILPPRKIVNRAGALGVDVLIITDHNTISGSVDARRISTAGRPLCIIAAEYQSEKGDIIGLFLKEEIQSRRSDEIVQQVRAQGGLVVLPHPFKGHALDDGLLAGVDLIETHNARCSPEDNARAAELAHKWNRPTLAGADAHCSLELSSAVNVFDEAAPSDESRFRDQLLLAPRTAETQSASLICRPYSQMVKAVKTGNPRLFLYQAKRLALALAQVERH